MTTIEGQCLLIAHCGQILHGEQVLCPVLEHCSVSSVSDELMRMLRHGVIEIVAEHVHDGGSLQTFMRILADRPGINFIIRPEAVYVNASVFFQLFSKFFSENCMMLFIEIAQ